MVANARSDGAKKMNTRFPIVLSAALGLVFVTSCGGSDEVSASDLEKGMQKDLSSLDVSTMSADEINKDVGGAISDAVKELAKVKDKASADEVVKKLSPILDQLTGFKTTLGDKMPDLSSLKTAAEALKTKFMADQSVQAALKPLLEKLKTLTS
jgi:ABC-type transporter Mla subunit MlaD